MLAIHDKLCYKDNAFISDTYLKSDDAYSKFDRHINLQNRKMHDRKKENGITMNSVCTIDIDE